MPPLNPNEQYRLKVLNQAINGSSTNDQVAKLLQISVRQVQRLKKAIKENGVESVVHKLKGKPGNHSIEKSVKAGILTTIKQTYPDFKPSFAAEKLKEQHSLIVNPETLRLWMIEEGLWKAHQQRKVNYLMPGGRERTILGNWSSLMAHTTFGLKKDSLMSMEILRKYASLPQ